jgi:hypothetical protein
VTVEDFLVGGGKDRRKVPQDRFRMARRSLTRQLLGMHHFWC